MADDIIPSVLNPRAEDTFPELKKLVMPAMGVLEAALTGSDTKLRVETAKWILSCFPETAPKKATESNAPSTSSITVNNLTVNMEKFKQIAEGVKKLEHAKLKLAGKGEDSIYGKRNGG